MSFFEELKRRNVVRVGIAYAVVAWVLLQVVDLVFEYITVPDWVMQVFMLALVLGFPIVLIIAWAFEITPEGVKREAEVDRTASIAPATGRKLDRITIVFLVVAVVFLVADRFRMGDHWNEPPAAVTETKPKPAVVPGATEQSPGPVIPQAEKSIAVLPFRDMSAAGDQAYFGEGIAEELLNALVKLDGIKVASRTSAFSLADEDLDIPTIAERLGVNHILEGSIRTSGQQVRVTAQLIEVSEDVHLWSETYDGTLDDIFKIQDEITAKITAAMKLQFGDEKLVSTAEALTDNPEAYQLYLQGRHFWRQRNAPALENAVRLFKKAVELDPEFHQAWSNLGVAYMNRPDYDHDYDIAEAFQLGLAAADRALALNPVSTEARIIRASALEFSCKVTAGVREYEAAIAGDPNDPTARHWYSIVLLAAGKTQQALEQIEAARRVDPLISAATTINALVLGALDRNDEAIQLAREAQALGFRGGATDTEGTLLIKAGRVKEGAALIRKAAAQEQDEDRRRLLELFAQAAEDPQKQHELEAFIGRAIGTHPYTAAEIIDLLVALGSPYVFPYLEGVECPVLGQNFWYPTFKEQRGTSEFFKLMERTGYVDYWREFGWPDDCASLDQNLAECPQ